jgi:hypothetical protein
MKGGLRGQTIVMPLAWLASRSNACEASTTLVRISSASEGQGEARPVLPNVLTST